MKEHPQAELLRAIADGKQMQWQSIEGQWRGLSEHDSPPLKILATGVVQLRIKPATILVNGIEVPEPMRVASSGEQYWIAAPTTTTLFKGPIVFTCRDEFNTTWLQRGLCHTSEANAIAHAKAMLAPSMKGGE